MCLLDASDGIRLFDTAPMARHLLRSRILRSIYLQTLQTHSDRAKKSYASTAPWILKSASVQ